MEVREVVTFTVPTPTRVAGRGGCFNDGLLAYAVASDVENCGGQGDA